MAVIPKMPEDFERWLLWRYTDKFTDSGKKLSERTYRRMWLSPFHGHGHPKDKWIAFVRECEARGLMITHSESVCRASSPTLCRVGRGKKCSCNRPDALHAMFTREGKAAFRAWRVWKELTK